MSPKHKHFVSTCCLLLLPLASACRTTGTINTAQPVQIYKLTPSYELQKSLGKPPVSLDQDDSIGRYKLEYEHAIPQYLLVVDPESVSGVLEIPSNTTDKSKSLVNNYNQYFDEILRIHRLILRGQLTEAVRLLNKLNEIFDLTYGSMILSGVIALLEKKDAMASEYFTMAQALYPDDQTIKNVISN